MKITQTLMSDLFLFSETLFLIRKIKVLIISVTDLLKLNEVIYAKGPAHGRHPLNGWNP